MSFHDVRFPTNVSLGSRFGFGFNTAITETDSGAEVRVARWSTPRHRYVIDFTTRDPDDVASAMKFLRLRRGALNSFRYKDWIDYASTADGRNSAGSDPDGNAAAAVSDTDQEIGVGDGATQAFQLVKTYSDGAYEGTRNITKPVAGTVVVSINDTSQPTGWTVNNTTGVVTFTTAPAASAVVKAGYEFDVPVRLGAESDRDLRMAVDQFANWSMPRMEFVEVIDEVPDADGFLFGGSLVLDPMTASRALTLADGRLIQASPFSAGLDLFMPDTAYIGSGGPYFVIDNISGSNSVGLRNNTGGSIGTVGLGETVSLYLVDGGSAKTWVIA